MYTETKNMLIMKMEKVYLVLCLCMNRNKLERDKLAVRIAEENELLREDFYKGMQIFSYSFFICISP